MTEHFPGATRFPRRPRHAYSRRTSNPARASVDRPITVSIDRIVVTIPRVGLGAFDPSLYEALELSDRAFVLAMMGAVVRDVATPLVGDIMADMCGVSVYRVPLAQMQARIDLRVGAWRERTLGGRSYPVLFLGTFPFSLPGKDERTILLGVAVDEDGNREAVGFQTLGSGATHNATAFLRRLVSRGLRGVDVVVTDGAQMVDDAVRNVFPNAIHAMCQTRATRAVLAVCPKDNQADLQGYLRAFYDGRGGESAMAALDEALGTRAPEAVAMVRETLPRATAVLTLSPGLRTRLRTIRTVDVLTEAFDRPTRVVRIFPDVLSAERLLGAIAIGIDETWADAGKYVTIPRDRVRTRA